MAQSIWCFPFLHPISLTTWNNVWSPALNMVPVLNVSVQPQIFRMTLPGIEKPRPGCGMLFLRPRGHPPRNQSSTSSAWNMRSSAAYTSLSGLVFHIQTSTTLSCQMSCISCIREFSSTLFASASSSCHQMNLIGVFELSHLLMEYTLSKMAYQLCPKYLAQREHTWHAFF
jgi:hypothetical protein